MLSGSFAGSGRFGLLGSLARTGREVGLNVANMAFVRYDARCGVGVWLGWHGAAVLLTIPLRGFLLPWKRVCAAKPGKHTVVLRLCLAVLCAHVGRVSPALCEKLLRQSGGIDVPVQSPVKLAKTIRPRAARCQLPWHLRPSDSLHTLPETKFWACLSWLARWPKELVESGDARSVDHMQPARRDTGW